jgi:hypothetical protein
MHIVSTSQIKTLYSLNKNARYILFQENTQYILLFDKHNNSFSADKHNISFSQIYTVYHLLR